MNHAFTSRRCSGVSALLLAPIVAALLSCSCSDDGSAARETLPSNAAGGTTPGVEPAAGPAPGASAPGDSPAAPPGAGGAAVVPGEVAAGGQPTQSGAGGTSAAQGAGGSAVVLEPAPAGTVLRIQAIGDSITRATCWRARLWEALNTSYAGRFDFVGTLQSNPGCTPATFDADNQGYSSSLITEIAAGITTARTCDPSCPTMADVAQAFVTADPDVVLMHFGTNDVWNGRAAADILNGYSQVVDAARAANPSVVVLVAQIIPMNVSEATCPGCTCAGCPTAVPQLGQQIVGWAASKSTAESPVVVVDQLTGYDATADNRDGVHPNDSGSQKIADRWLTALRPLFGG
jgi:lysophospholipase L1-like esterase